MSNNTLLTGWRQRWNQSLFRFLGRRVNANVDIEDLAQETYLRLLRARDLGEIRNPQAYLLQVANHVVIEWRGDQPQPGSMVELDEDQLVDEHPPELELDASLLSSRLDDALAAVSPTMRAVLLLRLQQGQSCKQIAEDLNITARQVRRYLARGYERLRMVMET
ncbi:MAG: sigma-70 family RNA polymerase sigma factor [Pseudomonadota bacterium]